MKPHRVIGLFAIVFAVMTAFFLLNTVRSVDYRDGEYHPIPRARYALIAAGFGSATLVTSVLWLIGRCEVKIRDDQE